MNAPFVARGDLLYLWHPDTEFVFSGYGLAVESGRSDLLFGRLMVDRPRPVSAAWLIQVKAAFGGFDLFEMTVTHERGIACQMRIEEDSQPYIRPLDMPVSEAIRQALMSLLLQPPQPRFVMAWRPDLALWTSTFDERPSSANGAQAPGYPLFPLGEVVATPGALDALDEANQTPIEFLARHVAGDWGELPPEDLRENARALERGNRLFSSYKLNDGTKMWIITEWDRSVTTLLLPLEY